MTPIPDTTGIVHATDREAVLPIGEEMSIYTTKFHSGVGGMLLIDPDGKSIPVDVAAERLNTLTAERDAARKEADALRGALKPFADMAEKNIGWTQIGRTIEAHIPAAFFAKAVAAIAPAPQPVPAPEPATPQPYPFEIAPKHSVHNTRKMNEHHIGTPALSRYAAAQIAKAAADKADERQGKK